MGPQIRANQDGYQDQGKQAASDHSAFVALKSPPEPVG
jgi:hypothetical protein